jgi:Zn-dependent protease with chaperone function
MSILGGRSAGDRSIAILLAGVLALGLVCASPGVSAKTAAQDDAVKLNGYAEWRRPGEVVVDGQRLRAAPRTKWRGKYTSIDAVPLGLEVRAVGRRGADGAIVGTEIDVRPNGSALFEADVLKGTDELEGLWLRSREAFEADGTGKKQVIGEIENEGRGVDRVRRIVRRVAPPYVDQSKLRVYVIDNKEWNAMAMGNGAIWVFRGLMDDMSDNELAIVVGHELAHYTHEHSRRQMRQAMWGQFGSLAALLAAEAIDNNALRAAAQLGSTLGFSAWMNGYGRDHEDQADRVGMRYAYEGGYDVASAPAVWQKFLGKYGEGNRVTNFFFSDHSRASARRKNLETEFRNNYAAR